MTAARRLFLAGAALLVAAGLAAWENDPSASLYTSSKWNKGDKATWESAIRTRNLAQNEYTRVE